MSCVACEIETQGPPVERRTNGQSSMAPEITAVARRRPLWSFLMNSSKESSTENPGARRRRVEPNIIIQADVSPRIQMTGPVHKLVLMRHGESQWNLENRFTGWTDVDLTQTGIAQARAAGRLLKSEGYRFDLAFTSVLKRAIRTLWRALDQLDQTSHPAGK